MGYYTTTRHASDAADAIRTIREKATDRDAYDDVDEITRTAEHLRALAEHLPPVLTQQGLALLLHARDPEQREVTDGQKALAQAAAHAVRLEEALRTAIEEMRRVRD
ncbi:hypothetical protein P3T27_007539 [Kitasatospora sp. MAA19]|uniref:hypothetical protein n=1 Tax=unclassified Kitasatospora TaxID=2633591 RepID=UPI002473F91B|nr:hypothetical protein [Kitasatospora sp. MAA19]MDH6710788.1 hypothetical protein [Kitasatospora sp. MAA19]